MAADRVADQEVSRLAGQVAQLTASIAAIERRLAALEGMLAMTAAPSAPRVIPPSFPNLEETPPSSPVIPPAETEIGIQAFVALIGRTLLVLGGAYFLRALTEASVLPASVGMAAGFVYAAAWIAAAARARDVSSATFHTLAASLITLPMIWEASFRFAVVGPTGGALLLGVFAAAGFVLAAGRRLEHLAWITGLGAALAAVVLGIATRGFVSYSVLVTLIGVAALWLGYAFEWVILRWPIAALAAAMVIGVTYRGAMGQDTSAAFAVQVLFFAAYLGSFAARTLFLGRSVVPFEVAQSICVIVLGFGGAVYLTSVTGDNPSTLGLLSIVFGALGYAVAFAFVERHRPARNFFFYGTLALTFVVVGAPLTFGWPGAALLYAALGAASGVAARAFTRWTLTLHCTVYLAGAVFASGLLGTATTGLVGAAGEPWPQLNAVQVVAFAAMVVCTLWPLPRSAATYSNVEHLPRLGLITLMTWIACGAFVAAVAPTVVPAIGDRLDAGPLAALRTTVLAAAAFVLARVRRDDRFAVAEGLVYPLLVVIGVKLMGEDMLRGRPSTLFVALAVYGAALIVIPRIMRRRERVLQ
jgi:hypothetical protein